MPFYSSRSLTIVAWPAVSAATDMTFSNRFDSAKAGTYTIIPTSEKECNTWRLLFSRRKLSDRDKKQLEDILEDTAYTCGPH